MTNAPYLNASGQWIIDRPDGSRLTFTTQDEANAFLNQQALADIDTSFVNWLVGKIQDMYAIQTDILEGEKRYWEQNCKPVVLALIAQNEAAAAQNITLKASNDSIPGLIARNMEIQAANDLIPGIVAQNEVIAANNAANPTGPQTPLLPVPEGQVLLTVPKEQALIEIIPIPARFSDFPELFAKASFLAAPRVDAPKFRGVMDVAKGILTGVPDGPSAVMYQVLKLPGQS